MVRPPRGRRIVPGCLEATASALPIAQGSSSYPAGGVVNCPDCNTSYTKAAWQALPEAGTSYQPATELSVARVETYRTCVCGGTVPHAEGNALLDQLRNARTEEQEDAVLRIIEERAKARRAALAS